VHVFGAARAERAGFIRDAICPYKTNRTCAAGPIEQGS